MCVKNIKTKLYDDIMDTFTYIISSFFQPIKSYNVSNKSLFVENDINNNLIEYDFIYSLTHKPYKNKFNILHNKVINNVYIQNQQKEILLDKFYKSQRAYNGFCKLARLYKIKKAKIFSADSDLCMNPLNELPSRIIIELYDDCTRTIYKFRISDLLNIINTSLTNSEDFFADPLIPMNPYVNLNFTHSQLYTIYFRVKETNYTMPHLFHMFFIHNFDIIEFCNFNECYIREITIKNFISSGSENDKNYYIKQMLVQYKNILNGVSIHPRFPVSTLIETFSKYLYYYLIELFSLNPTSRHLSKKRLKTMLQRFARLNPNFGRRVYTRRLGSQMTHNINAEIPNNFDFSSNNNTPLRSYYIDVVVTTETITYEEEDIYQHEVVRPTTPPYPPPQINEMSLTYNAQIDQSNYEADAEAEGEADAEAEAEADAEADADAEYLRMLIDIDIYRDEMLYGPNGTDSEI